MSLAVVTLDHQHVRHATGAVHRGRADHDKCTAGGVIGKGPGEVGQQQGTAVEIAKLAGGEDEALNRRESDCRVGHGAVLPTLAAVPWQLE